MYNLNLMLQTIGTHCPYVTSFTINGIGLEISEYIPFNYEQLSNLTQNYHKIKHLRLQNIKFNSNVGFDGQYIFDYRVYSTNISFFVFRFFLVKQNKD